MGGLLRENLEMKCHIKVLTVTIVAVIGWALRILAKSFSYINLGSMNCNKAIGLLHKFSSKPLNNAEATAMEVDDSIDLSIVVPIYNGEKYIQNCLDSIVNQETLYTVEVIVINDGSTDNSANILSQYTQNCMCIITQKNKGFSGARNAGIDRAHGKFLMFVDADDEIARGSVQQMIETAYMTNADIVQGEYEKIDLNGNRLSFSEIAMKNIDYTHKKEQMPGYPWGKIYRRELFKEVRFPENYWFEDSIIAGIVFQLADKVSVVENVCYRYRINPEGITLSFKEKPKCIDSVWILEELFRYVRALNITISDNWVNFMIEQFYTSMYARLHALPICMQKAAFEFSCSIINENVGDLNEYVLDNYLVERNAIHHHNFYLWKALCLKKRWGF